MKTGIANLPLHYGKSPAWLFSRMKNLSKVISAIIIREYGKNEFLNRLADPFWFQALGCLLGFDWHSSGLTTTVCAALKEALAEQELDVYAAGGKGKTSLKTLEEIEKLELPDNKIEKLKKASRLAAKVDNALVQDGFTLYHHTIFFTNTGSWCIVQQGMNEQISYARRYHWLSNIKSFVNEPHAAICCDKKFKTLNLTSKICKETRKASLDLAKEKNTQALFQEQKTLTNFTTLTMPRNHFINKKYIVKNLNMIYEFQPRSYEEMILIKGVGPETIRALALTASIIYGTRLDWKDPTKYAFAHGGKDGTPYPVNKKRMDKTIEILKDAIKQANLNRFEKLAALKRLSNAF